MRPICRGLLILLAPLLPVATAAAQSFSGGVIAGVSSSTVSNFGNVGPTMLRRETGLVAGFYVEASLARFASLQPEIVYVQKGIRLDGPLVVGASSTASARLTERFDYVEVPILVRLGAIARRPGLYALAGPAVAVLVRARERFEVPGVPTLDQDIKDGVTGTDAGVLVGAGFSTGRLGIEGRFDAGLRNLIPPADRRAGDRERTHRSISVAARLRF
jgi:Outer membrane protein beta-barrel domain